MLSHMLITSLSRAAALAAQIVVPTASGSALHLHGVSASRLSFWRVQSEANAAGVFHGVGYVTAIEPSNGALTLNHEDIKGLMPAMEMMYNVKSPDIAKGLAVGDKVKFDVDGKSLTILRVEKLGHGT